MAKQATVKNPDLTYWLNLFIEKSDNIEAETQYPRLHKIYFEEEINKKKKTLSADDLITVKKLLAILDKAAQKQGERLDIAGEIIELQELQNQRDSLSQVEYFIKNNQAKEALEEIVDYEKKFGNDEDISKLRTVAQELKKSNPLGVENKPITVDEKDFSEGVNKMVEENTIQF